MPERLELTRNAKFYRYKKKKITNVLINSILNKASENKITSKFTLNICRKSYTFNNLNYVLSARIFPTTKPVYFFSEDLEDKIYAFIVIIEYKNYLAIFQKSCASISNLLESNFLLMRNTDLIKTFNDDDVKFQKIDTRNMTVSDKAIRQKSLEAEDLKNMYSKHAAGRAIVSGVKLKDGHIIKSISSTGRYVEYAQRENIDDIAHWAINLIDLLINPIGNNHFLNSFAKKIALKEVLLKSQPNALLIDSPTLYERIENDSLSLIYTNRKTKKNYPLSTNRKNLLFSLLGQVYEVNKHLKISGTNPNNSIKINSENITLNINALKQIQIHGLPSTMSLLRFINKSKYYSITFNNPKYMYFSGQCFEDSLGISEIDSILEMLYPQPIFKNITSEKGTFSQSSTNFTQDSMFYAVEQIHKNDDYILCDDLGNEWADHITFNKNDSCINFIHSKHGAISRSASNFHEVVGQGIKNLGNMFFDKTDIMNHYDKNIHSFYKNNKVTTQITKVRKSDNTSLDIYLDNLLKDYKLNRKCILSCSFLSKKQISNEFNKIKNNQPVSGYITQLLWILSSFAHAVKEMNVIPVIYCQE